MISDDERREVARRLRMLQSRQFRDEERPEITTWEGIGAAVLPDDKWLRIDRLRSRDNRTRAVRSVIAGRLADLIEPNCDRDALLALAEELDKDADDIISAARNAQFTGSGPRMEEAKHDAHEWRCIASRIRKALGVEQ